MIVSGPSAGAAEDRAARRDGGAGPCSVLLITPRWARDGGVGAHVQRSAELLAARGIRVAVLAARVHSTEPIEGVTVHESPRLLDRTAPVAARLAGALSDSPELVHLHEVDEPPLLDSLRARAPIVVSAHGYSACTSGVYYFRPGNECARAHGPGCVPNLLARGCAHMRNPMPLPGQYATATRRRDSLALADLAVSYSSAVDRHLAANGISPRVVLPLFPTLDVRPPDAEPATPRVLFAGRITRAKGVQVLLRAARGLDAELVVCGDGPQLPAMRRLARRYRLGGRVRFTGWLAADALARELAEASIVAIPSVWPEPFGMVGIEGFLAERPAVATATGGIADWLEDGVSGLLVPPGDARALARALRELLADPQRRRAMGQAGRARALASFTPERHLAALLGGYERARTAFSARAS